MVRHFMHIFEVDLPWYLEAGWEEVHRRVFAVDTVSITVMWNGENPKVKPAVT